MTKYLAPLFVLLFLVSVLFFGLALVAKTAMRRTLALRVQLHQRIGRNKNL